MNSNIKGMVFDLQRFCMHDGPGIRSVLFLKGCPLHCVWCHNPESINPKPQLSFNAEICIDCKKCVNYIEGIDDPRKVYKEILSGKFEKYKSLAEICPVKAWEIIGRPVSVAEIADELEADRSFYDSSGGGVTLSGGEAMFQFDFTLALLKELKSMGIHTAIETSGASSSEKYCEISEYVDLFLWDYKLSDPLLYKKYVGGDFVAQRSNLTKMLDIGRNVVLRCVYLEGLHDMSHWENVAELCKNYTNIIGVRILPIHDLAKDKYRHLGKEYVENAPHLKDESAEITKIIDYLKSKGVFLVEY